MPAGAFPNGMNTMIPLLEASGHLQIKYSRNPKSMRLNLYAAQVAAPAARGAYLEFNPLDTIRKRSKAKWAYGTPAAAGLDNLQGFEQKNFFCERYQFPAVLDKASVDFANFDVQKVHSEKLGLQAMINRTEVALTSITNTALYPSTNTATAAVAGGGPLDGGTTADPRIFKAFTYAAQKIQEATGGRAGLAGARFGVIMNDKTALRLAQSREIREYVMQNPEALKLVTGDNENFMDASSYMLPTRLYKFDVVVEDGFINTGNPDSTLDVASRLFPDATIVVFVRTGGFNKEYGEADFNTFTQFVHEDMTVEAKTDDWDRLIYLRVVDNFDFKITSPKSGFVITSVFG